MFENKKDQKIINKGEKKIIKIISLVIILLLLLILIIGGNKYKSKNINPKENQKIENLDVFSSQNIEIKNNSQNENKNEETFIK